MTHHADPKSIEAGIEADRASLASTLNELQDRVSVEQIAKDAMTMIRTNASTYTRTIDEAVRSNPLALGLIGVGVAWLVFGQRKSDRQSTEPVRSQVARWEDEGGLPIHSDDDHDWHRQAERLRAKTNRSLRDLENRSSQSTRTIGSKLESGMDAVRDFAADKAQVMADYTAKLRQSLHHGLDDLTDAARGPIVAAREKAYSARLAASRAVAGRSQAAGHMIEDNPLVAGGIALALGAAVAAALPRSKMEDDLFGQESDRLMGEAARLLREERDRAARVVKGVGEELQGSVRDLVDGVAERAGGVAERVKERVVADATQDVAGDDPAVWHRDDNRPVA